MHPNLSVLRLPEQQHDHPYDEGDQQCQNRLWDHFDPGSRFRLTLFLPLSIASRHCRSRCRLRGRLRRMTVLCQGIRTFHDPLMEVLQPSFILVTAHIALIAVCLMGDLVTDPAIVLQLLPIIFPAGNTPAAPGIRLDSFGECLSSVIPQLYGKFNLFHRKKKDPECNASGILED